MENSKTKMFVAYLSFILLLLSCNNQETNKAVSKLQQDLEEVQTKLEQEMASNEIKNLTEFQKTYEVFQPLGAFSTKEDVLELFVPVPSHQFKVKQIENVSSKTLNAILVRVSDGSTAPASTEIKDIINEKLKLTELKLNVENLASHQNLKVIVYNSVDAFTEDEIEILNECIVQDQNEYLPKSCLNAIRNKSDNEDYIRPNDRSGSIIIGG